MGGFHSPIARAAPPCPLDTALRSMWSTVLTTWLAGHRPVLTPFSSKNPGFFYSFVRDQIKGKFWPLKYWHLSLEKTYQHESHMAPVSGCSAPVCLSTSSVRLHIYQYPPFLIPKHRTVVTLTVALPAVYIRTSLSTVYHIFVFLNFRVRVCQETGRISWLKVCSLLRNNTRAAISNWTGTASFQIHSA